MEGVAALKGAPAGAQQSSNSAVWGPVQPELGGRDVAQQSSKPDFCWEVQPELAWRDIAKQP